MMHTRHTHHAGRGPASRRLAAGAATAAAFLFGACDLDVSTPAIVPPDALRDSTALPTLLAGATGDFALAYAGNPAAGDEGMILVGGLRADEWLNRDTFEERRDIDLGTMRPDNGSLRDLFRNVQRARRSAEFAAARFAEFGATQADYARVLSLAGFSYLLLGENFCSGVPISDLDENNQFEFGQPLSTNELFERAVAKFDSALAVAAAIEAAAVADEDDDLAAAAEEQANLARVGRARALLNLGPERFAEAAASVADVPVDFSFDIEYSENTSRQNNAVFTFNNINRRWGVADTEGGNGLPFVSAADPRVPTMTSTRNGLDGVNIRVVNQLKYPSRSASIPLASGVEAQLIVAEAALAAGDVGAFAATHNALRTAAGLPPLVAAGLTPDALEDLHFRERGFWLFSTAHRLGDMRRLLRPPYDRPFAQVFPQGEYFKSPVPYGDQSSLIIPLEEENNPNFAGCQAGV